MDRTRQVYRACLDVIPHKKVHGLICFICSVKDESLDYIFQWGNPKYQSILFHFSLLLLKCGCCTRSSRYVSWN